jgi:hypothetical protein
MSSTSVFNSNPVFFLKQDVKLKRTFDFVCIVGGRGESPSPFFLREFVGGLHEDSISCAL